MTENQRNEGQTVVHFIVPPLKADLMRIWKSTFLKPNNTEKVSKMILNHNISTFPKWTKINTNKMNSFTLIFESLPKECTSFDLIEDALEDGGFYYKNIKRNSEKFIRENIENEIQTNNVEYKHPYIDPDSRPKHRICLTCMNRNKK
mgnify:CR=1 FL=1